MLDTSEWTAFFDRLKGPAKESLARRMGVAAGRVLRDEAKVLVPISMGPFNPKSRGAQEPYVLREAIYVAYNKKLGGGNEFVYSVSWNAQKAWFGKLVEFGYLQKYRVIRNEKTGEFFTVKGEPSRRITRVPAHSFLGAAMHSARDRATEAAMEAAKHELPILLAGGSGEPNVD